MVCVEQRERQYTFFLFIVMFNNTINQNQMNNSNPIVTLSHETGIILSKQSSESEIKRYFNKVLELSKSDNEFPINLDEMWMLVYGRKSDAAEALQRDFIEGVDYQVLRQNPQNSNGGRPTNEYKLTVSCMEFFIARKVRPVFEVYRQVFHKAAKHELSRKELAIMVIQAEEEKERLALKNEQQQKQILKLQPKADFADAAFKAENSKVDIGQAAKILNLGFGRNTLFKKLKEIGVFFSNRNEPKQKYVDAGYFEMTEKFIERNEHPGFVVTKVICTQKGLAYINTLFGGNKSDGKLARIV